MLEKSLSLFNEFHGINATITNTGEDHYTLHIGDLMRGFTSKGELVHYLMCGTTHIALTSDGDYYTAYNIAMMYLNRRCGCNNLVFSVASNGKTTLWGLDGVSWYRVGEYSCLTSLYYAILMGNVSSIREAVRGQASFLSKLKRLLS